jgi:pyruvate dehydrogenase phosphatase regulatory subunit
MTQILPLPGLHYGLIYPFHEFKTGRNLRMSPIYPKLREAGAVFGQVMGYERPTWFDQDYVSGMYLECIMWHQVGTNVC